MGGRTYVTRDGYHQAVTYATEVSTLGSIPTCGVMVGPDSVIPETATVLVGTITIVLAGPRHLAALFSELDVLGSHAGNTAIPSRNQIDQRWVS